MVKLYPGCGIWFSEAQRDGSSKDVPAVVLWAEDGRALIVIARGTSQTGHNSGGFSDDGALEFHPTDIVGRRLGLTRLTRFRSNDVKRIELGRVVKSCGVLPRGDWKKLAALTQKRVEELVRQSRTPPPSVAEDVLALPWLD